VEVNYRAQTLGAGSHVADGRRQMSRVSRKRVWCFAVDAAFEVEVSLGSFKENDVAAQAAADR
jgi:hypothetical protein